MSIVIASGMNITVKTLATSLLVSGLVVFCAACSPDPAKKPNEPSGAVAPDTSSGAAPSDSNPPTPAPDASPSDTPAPSAPLTFHGYDCTDDCSGHQAGYDWAEQHGITDPDQCGGNSESFIEGCKAYAGEEGPDGDDDDDKGDDN